MHFKMHAGDPTAVSHLLNLCDYGSSPSIEDKQNLFATLASSFDGVVQYNGDNRGFEHSVII